MATTLCDDITAFKKFLGLSRMLVDDTITQNLNNLVHPTRFTPESTVYGNRNTQLEAPIDKIACNTLLQTVFENWSTRSKLIDSCLLQASAHDGVQLSQASNNDNSARRLDPYAGRHFSEKSILQRTCEQEQGTENIVRERTWRIVVDRCDALKLSKSWESAFALWLREKRIQGSD